MYCKQRKAEGDDDRQNRLGAGSLRRRSLHVPAALALVGWLMVGGFSYCLFKFLGELSWLLADFGDHQVDTRNLLIDLRDSIERK